MITNSGNMGSSLSGGLGHGTGKKTIGSITGTSIDTYFNDDAVFNEYWQKYINEKDEIHSSEDTLNEFIKKLDSEKIQNAIVMAKMKFLAALCYYQAIGNMSISNTQLQANAASRISQAISLKNEPEYRMFQAVIDSKVGTSNIVGQRSNETILNSFFAANKAIPMDTLLDSSFYLNEIEHVIQEEVDIYKKATKDEANKTLLNNSLWMVPIFLFIFFKYMAYEPPTGWFSFNWSFVYWIGMILFGWSYLLVVLGYRKNTSKSEAEWRQLALKKFL